MRRLQGDAWDTERTWPPPPDPLPAAPAADCCCSLHELSLEGDFLSLDAEAADHLARALPQRCRLLVSLVPAQGHTLPAGPAPTEADEEAPMHEGAGQGEAPMQVEGAGHAAAQLAAQRAQRAGAPSMAQHLAALQALRQALGQRLVVEDTMLFSS